MEKEIFLVSTVWYGKPHALQIDVQNQETYPQLADALPDSGS